MIKCIHLVSIILRAYYLHRYREPSSVIASPGVSFHLRRISNTEMFSDVGDPLTCINGVDSGFSHSSWLAGGSSNLIVWHAQFTETLYIPFHQPFFSTYCRPLPSPDFQEPS